MDDDTPARIPKYRAPDFMRKEMGLFYQARFQTQMMRRYGDDDAPIRPIAAIAAVRAIRPIRPLGRIDRID
jgi:hypothetical protein